MQQHETIKKVITILLLLAGIAGLFLAFEWRTENNIRRVAESCEKAGMTFEIRSISWSGGVESRCVIKPRLEVEEGVRSGSENES